MVYSKYVWTMNACGALFKCAQCPLGWNAARNNFISIYIYIYKYFWKKIEDASGRDGGNRRIKEFCFLVHTQNHQKEKQPGEHSFLSSSYFSPNPFLMSSGIRLWCCLLGKFPTSWMYFILFLLTVSLYMHISGFFFSPCKYLKRCVLARWF